MVGAHVVHPSFLFIFFARHKRGLDSLCSSFFSLHFFCSPKRNEAKKRAFPEGLRKFLAYAKTAADADRSNLCFAFAKRNSACIPAISGNPSELLLMTLSLYRLAGRFLAFVGNQGKAS